MQSHSCGPRFRTKATGSVEIPTLLQANCVPNSVASQMLCPILKKKPSQLLCAASRHKSICLKSMAWAMEGTPSVLLHQDSTRGAAADIVTRAAAAAAAADRGPPGPPMPVAATPARPSPASRLERHHVSKLARLRASNPALWAAASATACAAHTAVGSRGGVEAPRPLPRAALIWGAGTPPRAEGGAAQGRPGTSPQLLGCTSQLLRRRDARGGGAR